MVDEVAEAERILARAGIETARQDAEWIAAAALGQRRSMMLAHMDRSLTDGQAEHFGEMVSRRAKREPLGYVIGTVAFRGLELEVGPGVLVPRPETEVTAGRGVARTRECGPRATVVDVGTGCGAIALAIAAEVPDARIFATDASGAARGWTLRNLARTGLRCTLLPGDLLSPLHPSLGGAVDVVVSNPPYVSESEWEVLEPEVRRFEPKDAIVAGPTGLEVIRTLLRQVRLWSVPGGWLVVEIAASHADEVVDLFEAQSFTQIEMTQDLAGRPRVVEGRWIGPL